MRLFCGYLTDWIYGSQCESLFCVSYSKTEKSWWISSQNTPVAPKITYFSIPHITYGNLGKSGCASKFLWARSRTKLNLLSNLLSKIKWAIHSSRLLCGETGSISCSVRPLTSGKGSNQSPGLHPSPSLPVREQAPQTLQCPPKEGKMTFKGHWWCPDWHRDTAGSQFTLLISQTSKDVSQIKITGALNAAAILRKWECSYICLGFLLLSYMNKILDFCNPFSFPSCFYLLLPAPPYTTYTSVLDTDRGLVTQL